MLSAQKQEMPNDTPTETARPSAATGFGKVLNSIQGLQQRLDDFSVEQVSDAHAQANVLIRKLGDLQAQLSALTKLKQASVSANGQIAAATPENDLDLIGPDSLENHPQLRAIVQAGKLIRMHRSLQAAQASAQDLRFNLETPKGDLLAQEPVERNQANPSEEAPVAPADGVPSAPIVEVKTAVSAALEPRDLPNSVSGDRNIKPAPPYEFTELKLEDSRATTSLDKADASSAAVPSQRQNPQQRKKNKAEAKPQIDQRLLNDLIETYGEFAISAEPVAHVENRETTAPLSLEAPQAATMLVAAKTVPAETTLPVTLPPTSDEPAFVQARDGAGLALPARAEARPEPAFEGALPSTKSRGEIDRQLKSIIKDYGEYDLYSHQKSVNVKAAAIAAAAVALALVLGGFFFFRSAPSPAPATIETTGAPAAHTPETGITKNLP